MHHYVFKYFLTPPPLTDTSLTYLLTTAFILSTLTQPSQLRPAIGRAYLPSDPHIIPREASNLEEFLLELKPALDAHQLSFRPVHLIFNDSFYFTDIPHPACQGLWLEFGVFTGSTLNLTAEFRERHCGPTAGPVYGFDTFTGLPENWAGGFVQGAFSLEGDLPHVRHNIELVKGLFSDSLPPWMQAQRDANMGEFPPVTYLHIDCDLYAGARDALTLLKEHISPGCVLIFDEVSFSRSRYLFLLVFWVWVGAWVGGKRILETIYVVGFGPLTDLDLCSVVVLIAPKGALPFGLEYAFFNFTGCHHCCCHHCCCCCCWEFY